MIGNHWEKEETISSLLSHFHQSAWKYNLTKSRSIFLGRVFLMKGKTMFKITPASRLSAWKSSGLSKFNFWDGKKQCQENQATEIRDNFGDKFKGIGIDNIWWLVRNMPEFLYCIYPQFLNIEKSVLFLSHSTSKVVLNQRWWKR